MDSTTVIRRLAAIVIADVVGYTRLMEHDDTGTYARVRLIRDEVVDPAILSHGGRIVKTAGDGLVAEFTSALAALRASIQIQRQMAVRNQTAIADERIDYRIGVNLGAIMVEGNDIAGDGVNVASRLEALAEPGGICVSSGIREQVHGQLDVEFVDGGEQSVKNIARPIRVYRVNFASGTRKSEPGRRTVRRPTLALRRAAVGVAVFLLAGIGAWSLTAMRPRDALAPPPFSVAVLPFTASSSVSTDGDVAGRLTRDMTTSLGQWRWMNVASKGLVPTSTGASVDARTANHALGVRHVVEGDVGRSGEKLIVTVRVVDAASGTQTWSDRMEFPPSLLVAEPDAMRIRTANHVVSAIVAAERRRAVQQPDPASALNWVLRGNAVWTANASRLKGAPEARKLYDEALRIDPHFVPALIQRANTLHWELYEDPHANRNEIAAEMESLSQRAIAVDPQDASAWYARADALGWLARWEEALAANDKAHSLAPTDLGIWDNEAWLRYAMGRPLESLAIARRIIAIDPPGEAVDWYYVCRGNLMLGQYKDAVPACETAAALDGRSWQNQLQLLAAYAQNGDMARASVVKAKLLELQPGYTIAIDRARLFSDHPAFVKQVEAHLYPGLRKAGIPEQ
jgi:adenylate cyclase